MPKVKFTSNLKRFYADLDTLQVSADSVAAALAEVEEHYNGLRDYIIDENGALRDHVNIYIGSHLIKDRKHLLDKLSPNDEVYVMQAISGG